jgi:hypothetical protein
MIFISFILKMRSAVILPLLLGTASLQAATYNVNTTADGTSSSGTVNLRGAILAANTAGGSHTVNVPAGTYNLTLGEITFGTTAQNITISGSGSVTINMQTGANQDRIFNINPSAIPGVTTSVSGIAFTNGYLRSDGYGGGAIISGGSGCALNLTNCSFSNNTIDPTISLVYGGGGAVAFVYGGALTVTNCQFSGNSISFPTSIAANYRTGGAIYAYAYGAGSLYPDLSINISGSTFTGNSVSNSGQGGAIFVQTDANGTTSAPTYSVSITKNNFLNNTATGTSGLGGAVSVLNNLSGSATSAIQYNRFYGNTSGGGNASALYMDNNSGSINATNNWWGCNGGPTACADKAYRNTTTTNGGTLTSTPYMQLKAAASPTSICAGATSVVTADFSQNSAASTIAAANLSAFTGVPISFQAALGTVSPTSTTLSSSAAATTTYTAGSTAGSGTVNALVDNVPASDVTARATVTINPATGIGTAPPATTTVCAGNTATISVTASGGGAPTYQWRRGTTNLSNGPTGTGSTLSGVTGATLTITNAGASDAAANYNVVITGCGSVTSSNVALVISTPGTWLGGTSVAWSNTANWSCGVLPTSATNVLIPAGTPFSPQVNITNAAVNDITIANGASLSFSGSANALSVSGAITNTGTLNPANGRISFDGTNQSIPALSYDGLTISGGGTKTAAGAITVNTSLVLGNGYLALGANNLTIGSAGAISGATPNGFVLINGTGNLVQQNIGATGRSGAILFPVGISSGSYTPVSLTNTGTSDAFSVDLLNAVYAAYDAAGNPTSAAETMNAVARTWRVTEGTPGGSTATLSFQWSTSDELPGFTRSSCYASHYYSGAWHRGAVSAASGSNPYTQTLTGVTTFSPFGVGSGASPLPLQLLSFGGEARATFNELRWTIAAQQDNLRFEVQRSNDGANFAAIGIVDGEGPAYVFNDVEPAAMRYYRLAMIDGSGERSYSKIVSLRRAAAASGLEVRPNPFRDRIFIQLKNTDASLVHMELRNAPGQLILQRDEVISPANPTTTISGLEQLPAGIYFLMLNYGQNAEQLRLLKE